MRVSDRNNNVATARKIFEQKRAVGKRTGVTVGKENRGVLPWLDGCIEAAG